MTTENTNANTNADENANAGTPPTSETSQTDDKDKNWRNLEEARNKEAQRANKLLESTITTIADTVGVDVSKGHQKLLVDAYKNSLGDEDVPTKDSFVEFLKSQDYEVQEKPSSQEQSLDNFQVQTQNIRSDSSQPRPNDLDDLIGQAEKAGNWGVAMEMKLLKQTQGL